MKELSPGVVEQNTPDDSLPWNLPPNFSSSETFLFEPATYSSLYSKRGDGYLKGFIGTHLARQKRFTVEGWIRLTKVGGTGGAAWVVLANHALAGSEAESHFHFRMTTKNNLYYLHVWAPHESGNAIDSDFDGPGLTAEQLVDGKWHHWAYTHLPDNGQGERLIEAFWDGVSVGTLKGAAIQKPTAAEHVLMLGTRNLYGNTIQGAMDYIRISDEILRPSEFLCAGSSGTKIVPATSRTLGYWRLGRDANGGVDGTSALSGNAFVGSCLRGSGNDARITAVSNYFAISSDQAFENQPPNETGALPTKNNGSYSTGNGTSAMLAIPGLGAHLAASRDFTIEMYYRPDHREETVTGSRYLIGTQAELSSTSWGWSWLMCSNARTATIPGRYFRLWASDQQGELYYHQNIGVTMEDWTDEWRHLALVHHATGGAKGYGFWEVFVNGESTGTLHDERPFGAEQSETLYVGRNLSTAGSQGRYDALRISGEALSPEQFLCTPGGTAPSNVLAYFPFDRPAAGAAYPALIDEAGSYSQNHAIDPAYIPAVSADEPVVTHPDNSPRRSLMTDVSGSLSFQGSENRLSQLLTTDAATLAALNSTDRAYTIELYLKRTGAAPTGSGNEQIFLASHHLFISNWPDMQIRLAYGNTGFVLSDTGLVSGSGFQDRATQVFLPGDQAWHHVALSVAIDSENDRDYGTWRLYLDGEEKWTSEKLAVIARRSEVKGLMIGGRTWSASSFQGALAHLRISHATLTPADFLCAPPAAAEPAVTKAYWPLDCVNGTLDLGERVARQTPFRSAAAVGTSERAVLKAVTATTPVEAVVNKGAAVVSHGVSLEAPSAASAVAGLDKPFTLEGYLKWTGAETDACAMICGTYRNGNGWKLMIDPTAAQPCFRLFGCGRLPTSAFVNRTLGALPGGFADAWHHVALSYEPVETGRWTLWVDGQLIGSAVNDWRAAGNRLRQSTLLLGSSEAGASFSGFFDLWRLSIGAREPMQFLYPGVSALGTLFLIR